MEQRDQSFVIKAENFDKALKAVQGLAGHETIADGSGTHFSWVNNNFAAIDNLFDILDEWRWNAVAEENGDIDTINFDGEKLGDDLVLFNAIAPYVKKGSFIEMQGEDGALWRWVFDGETCKEIYATVSWDDT